MDPPFVCFSSPVTFSATLFDDSAFFRVFFFFFAATCVPVVLPAGGVVVGVFGVAGALGLLDLAVLDLTGSSPPQSSLSLSLLLLLLLASMKSLTERAWAAATAFTASSNGVLSCSIAWNAAFFRDTSAFFSAVKSSSSLFMSTWSRRSCAIRLYAASFTAIRDCTTPTACNKRMGEGKGTG